MIDEPYMIAITALLPLMAVIVVLQTNPYQALVVRGILGAIAALVYALFGAADVALTEALVGTMLSITLYAIAVRSSMTLRIGIIEHPDQLEVATPDYIEPDIANPPTRMMLAVKQQLQKYHVRVEVSAYDSSSELSAALSEKEIHAAYESTNPQSDLQSKALNRTDGVLRLRGQHLQDILSSALPPTVRLEPFEPQTAAKT